MFNDDDDDDFRYVKGGEGGIPLVWLIVHFYSGMAKERGIGSCLIFRIWDKDSRVLEGSEYFNIGFSFFILFFRVVIELGGSL